MCCAIILSLILKMMFQVSGLAGWVLNKAYSSSLFWVGKESRQNCTPPAFCASLHWSGRIDEWLLEAHPHIFQAADSRLDSEILCGIENSWLMCPAAPLRVQLLLRFGVRRECECSLQAKLADMSVCLLLCLPLQAAHCQLSVITFFFQIVWLINRITLSQQFILQPKFAASASSLKRETGRKSYLFPIWYSNKRFAFTLHIQLYCDMVPWTPNTLVDI